MPHVTPPPMPPPMPPRMHLPSLLAALAIMLVGTLYLATTISRLVAVFKPSGIRNGGDGDGAED